MNSQAPKKRGRGRPAKVAAAVSVLDKSPPRTKSPASSPNGEAAKSPVKPPTVTKSPPQAAVKKGRGRPKGVTSNPSQPKKAVEHPALFKGGVTKKGATGKRGRPKKNATSEESSGDQSDGAHDNKSPS